MTLKNFSLNTMTLLIFLPCLLTAVPRNFHTIESGLAYRCAQPTGNELKKTIQLYQIKSVLNLKGAHPNSDWWQKESAACNKENVKLYDVPMSACALPSQETLLLLYDSLVKAEPPILIHCQAGANRTGAAAAIWRMVILNESRNEAIKELSPKYFHFKYFNPKMDLLLEIFQPDRDWILTEYPLNLG